MMPLPHTVPGQLVGVPTHAPPPHASIVQSSPSSQAPVVSVCVHWPERGTHVSSVHALPSLQSASVAVCTQTPVLAQLSTVHGKPSSQPAADVHPASTAVASPEASTAVASSAASTGGQGAQGSAEAERLRGDSDGRGKWKATKKQ